MLSRVLVFFSVISNSLQFHHEVFDEELFIKPLHSGHIYSYFQFTTRWELGDGDSLHHTHLTSRSIAELFQYYNINELHISFTSGLWRYQSWGYPVVDAGPGAEVWAWFKNDSIQSIDEKWRNLCGTLSGLFCASLSFIDKSNTFEPAYTLRPQFYANNASAHSIIRYAALPREIVCTENLTPWKKLLPCNIKEGFVSLLNPDQIYSTNYHSLGVHMRKLCIDPECRKYQIEVKQTVNLVHDLVLFNGIQDWSIRKLFGSGLVGASILTDSSKLYLDITDQDYHMTKDPDSEIISIRGGATSTYLEFDIKKLNRNHDLYARLFNLAIVDKKDSSVMRSFSAPPIYAKRYILGVGQERGKIVTKISNNHWSALNLVVFENIPWFVPVYLHTMTIKAGNTKIKPNFIKYIPGQPRKRPYHLEIGFKIPARTTVDLSIDFDYIFLKWQEYPPDANHGHYIQSSIISVYLPIARNYTAIPINGALFKDSFNATQSKGYFTQIRTEALLLTLPTPDFSMPYNVICLTCTVVALAFGPIHNISTKRLTLLNKADGESKGLFSKLKKIFKKDKSSTYTIDIDEKDDEKKD